MRTRRVAARVVLVDPADHVLLLWHARQHDDQHWSPPGGGVEAGESLEEAARRELREEVGYVDAVDLVGPVWTWEHDYSFDGKPIRQRETIYLARVPRFEPAGDVLDLAVDGIVAWRWWSLDELGLCPDDVWPHGLAERLPSALEQAATASGDIEVVALRPHHVAPDA